MSAEQPRLVFAGGGTGGHLYPALAVIEALRALHPGLEVLFLGSDRPLERRLLEAAGQRHQALPTAPWPGLRRLHQGVRFLSRQLDGARAARRALSEFKPQLVVGLGGFPSVGPVLAAFSLRIPAALFEPNAVSGLANRLLAPLVEEAYVQWPEVSLRCERVISGTPVRRAIHCDASPAAAAARLGLDPEKPVLLVLGGSQGSRALNRWLEAGLAGRQGPLPCSLLLLCGREEEAARLEAALARRGPGSGRALAFLEDIGLAYRAADFVVARGGGSTLAELQELGIPGAVVPIPNSVGDHQRANARAFAASGAGSLLEEQDLTPESFQRLLEGIQRRTQHPSAARGGQRAASRVARRLVSLAGWEDALNIRDKAA